MAKKTVKLSFANIDGDGVSDNTYDLVECEVTEFTNRAGHKEMLCKNPDGRQVKFGGGNLAASVKAHNKENKPR